MKRVVLLAGCWALLTGIGQAQDYPRIAPKEVTPVAPAGQVPSTPAPKAETDGQVLLPKLKGLVFVARPDQVVKNGVNTMGLVIKNVPVPDEADFEKLAANISVVN